MSELPNAARLGDHHTCPCCSGQIAGKVLPICANTVVIGGQKGARKGDAVGCKCASNAIADGEPTVLLVGEWAARRGDATDQQGEVADGCETVLIGSCRKCDDGLCQKAWEMLKKERNDILSNDDAMERNRMFNAKYAQLYGNNNELQWAGAAAFGSKGVGCALQKLSTMSAFGFRAFGPAGWLGPEVVAGYLAAGNAAVFNDIYPVLALYNVYARTGDKRCFLKCLESLRQSAEVPGKLAEGMSKVAGGDLKNGALEILRHEQYDILPKAMYDNKIFRLALDTNKRFGIADMNGVFSAACSSADPNLVVEFGKGDLYNLDDRWRFTSAVVEKFIDLSGSDAYSSYINEELGKIVGAGW